MNLRLKNYARSYEQEDHFDKNAAIQPVQEFQNGDLKMILITSAWNRSDFELIKGAYASLSLATYGVSFVSILVKMIVP